MGSQKSKPVPVEMGSQESKLFPVEMWNPGAIARLMTQRLPVHTEFKRSWAISTKLTWTNEELQRLRKRILAPKCTKSGKPMKLKILIFGPTGMGKSSFANGVLSAVEAKEHVSNYFPVGSSGTTFTKGFHGAKIGDKWLIDMGGIFESSSITDQNIRDIASGKIPFYAKLTENLEVKDRKKLMVPAAGKNDVACVVIVLTLGTELPPEIKRQLACIMNLAGEGVLSYRLVLTHPDNVDSKFKDPRTLPSVFDSKSVQNAVMDMASETGVPPSNISVVRNYAYEPSTDLYSNILFLNALDIIVSSAQDQAEKKAAAEELINDPEFKDQDEDDYSSLLPTSPQQSGGCR